MANATDDGFVADVYKQAIEVFAPAVNKLLMHYEGFGSPDTGVIDKKDIPSHQIQHYFEQIDIYYPGAGYRKLKLAIRSFLSKLGCFNYRVTASANGKTIAVWNPLEQPLHEFKSLYKTYDISYKERSELYPAEDLICDWITQQIDESIFDESPVAHHA